MTIKFSINGKQVSVGDDKSDMPLLWYLREDAGLKGTKFGCGIGQCGACTVHLNGNATRSCSMPLAAVNGARITTIEGLATDMDTLHPVQAAWKEIDVPQCGYCQSGQIMAAAALLQKNPKPSDEDIDNGMTNICRCASYTRIRDAVKAAAKNLV